MQKCEYNASDGTRTHDAVVMDGTALGILGKLPTFKRHRKVVSAMHRISDKQFLMRNPRLCGFLHAIYRSTKRTSMDNTFNVSVKESLWRKRHEIASLLLDSALTETHEACLVAKFVKYIFQIYLTEKPCNSQENDCFYEEENPSPGHLLYGIDAKTLILGELSLICSMFH